jgi:bifunctional non-homologous end joining protein LigD
VGHFSRLVSAGLGRHQGPSLDPRDRRLEVEVEDHPFDYGDFEGTIPQGRGHPDALGPGLLGSGRRRPERALRKGDLKFTLAGEKAAGQLGVCGFGGNLI